MATYENIYDLVQKSEIDYRAGSVSLGKYVNFSMNETIENIFAYINSRYLSGNKDAKGREKPFFNIITAIRNIWYRATYLDRKNIRI